MKIYISAFAVFFSLATLFISRQTNGQDYFLIGSVSDCSVTGENPLVYSYSCKKYLNVSSGVLECSAVSENDPAAHWEIKEKEKIVGAIDRELYLFFVIRNKLSGKYLNIQSGILQCSAESDESHDAQWSFNDTDFNFFYWITNRESGQQMVNADGVLSAANFDSFPEGRRDAVWYYFKPDQMYEIEPGVSNNPISNNTSSESQSILERHNYWRAQLGIAPLTWSVELAAYAQQWANELSSRGCQMEHRPSDGQWKQLYGENLYWAMGGNLSGVDAVESWAAEQKDFDHNTQEGNGGVVGHYTQMIWENTTQVGCAKVVCSDGSVLWVCNYNPPGNWSGEKPYKKK